MNNSFYNTDELKDLGFKSIGDNVLISRNASFYGAENMSIGHNVRIDDFCILSGRIEIGSYVHISAYCVLYGSRGIDIGNYSGLSARCTIFSAVDDFSGDYLINPMISEEYTNVSGGKVIIGDYVQLGASTMVMPNLQIADGVVSGAFVFINKSLEEWNMYIGIPAVLLKKRTKNLLEYVKKIELNF